MIVWNINWVLVLTFIVATVLPLLVALVTTKYTSSKIKGVLLAALAFLTSLSSGILDALVNQEPYDMGQQLVLLGGVFVWSVASYFGVWRAEGKGGTPSIAEKITTNAGRTIKLDPSTYTVRDDI